MKSCGMRNAGVDFLLDNMQSNQFAQTLLGFNTTIRMKLDKKDKTLTVSYESEQFKSWSKAVSGEMESILKEKFGDKLGTVSDDGFDLSMPCPDGISEETKTAVSELRHNVYVAVFQKIMDDAPLKKEREAKFTDGTAVKINGKCQAYICKTKEKGVSCTWTFQEPQNKMEKELLHVFLQEFAGVRKGNKNLQSAPPVSFASVDGKPLLQMTFGTRHLEKVDTVCRCIYSVPDDIDYHMKASKTFFHHNMHVQVKEWLQTLNRADPTKAQGNKKKQARKSLRT